MAAVAAKTRSSSESSRTIVEDWIVDLNWDLYDAGTEGDATDRILRRARESWESSVREEFVKHSTRDEQHFFIDVLSGIEEFSDILAWFFAECSASKHLLDQQTLNRCLWTALEKGAETNAWTMYKAGADPFSSDVSNETRSEYMLPHNSTLVLHRMRHPGTNYYEY